MAKNNGIKTAFELILLAVAVQGCNCCDCKNRKKNCAPKRDTVYVVKEIIKEREYHVGGDMINIEGDNNDVNLTKGNGNNTSARNSGTENWGRGTRPQPKKVVKKPVEQPKTEPEQKTEPKPEVTEESTCTVVITWEDACRQYGGR